jgi:hypothetical protein
MVVAFAEIAEYQYEEKDVEKCIKVNHSTAKKKKQDNCTTNAQFTMYDRIFKKKPNTMSMEWGRDFLRIFHPLQWKVHNRNLCMVRSWFNDTKDEKVNVFFNANLREQKEVVHIVKQFISNREPTLVALLFMENGTTTCMRWKVEDIYEWYKEHKHYISNKAEKVRLTNKLVSFFFLFL